MTVIARWTGVRAHHPAKQRRRVNVTKRRITQKLKQRQPHQQQRAEKKLVRQSPPELHEIPLKLVENPDVCCALILCVHVNSNLFDTDAARFAQSNSANLCLSPQPVAQQIEQKKKIVFEIARPEPARFA